MFAHKQPVRFPDVDHAGIAFFATLVKYCHYAHEEWLKELGYPLHQLMATDSRWGFPVVAVEATFASPAYHGDVINIEVHLEKLGNKSMKLRYELSNDTTGKKVGTTTITQVCSDLKKMTSIPVPQEFRNAVDSWVASN